MIVCYTHRNKPLQFLPVGNTGHVDSSQAFVNANCAELIVEANVANHLPLLTPNKLALFPDDYLLFFWAESAFFTVKSRKPSSTVLKSFNDYYKDPRTIIQNGGGETIGSVCKMPPQASKLAKDIDTDQKQFIAVARRAIPEVPDYPQIILVLQIEWKEGITYRVNMGEIKEEAWQAASPKRSLIVLG
jgi:hypothetical protein